MPRLTVDLPDGLSSMLADLAKAEDTSKREVLRRAIALYHFLRKQGVQNGQNKLSITDDQDKILKEIVI